MRIERITSNLPSLRDNVALRTRVALGASSRQEVAQSPQPEDQRPSPSVLVDTTARRNSVFDDNGDFQLPVIFGMGAYRSAEQNTCARPGTGTFISVYA